MKKAIFTALIAAGLLLSACGQGGPDPSRFSSEDFYLSINGAQYRTDMNIASVIADLGADYDYAEAKSCDYDGLDKTFIYEAAEFYTYPMPEGDLINEIYSASPLVSTSKGISVGATKEEVLDSYGGSCKDTNGQLTYTLPGSQENGSAGALCFDIQDDVVTAISVTTRPL